MALKKDDGRRWVEMEFVTPGTPEQIWQTFTQTYLHSTRPFQLESFRTESAAGMGDSSTVICVASVAVNGCCLPDGFMPWHSALTAKCSLRPARLAALNSGTQILQSRSASKWITMVRSWPSRSVPTTAFS